MFPLKPFQNKKRTLRVHLTFYLNLLMESLQNLEAHPGNNIKKTFLVIFYKSFNNSMLYYISDTPIILLQNASFNILMVRCNNILLKRFLKQS